MTGGFGGYLFAMSEVVAKQSPDANNAMNIKNPGLGWMIAFLFVVSFLGLFTVVPLRKVQYSRVTSRPIYLYNKLKLDHAFNITITIAI